MKTLLRHENLATTSEVYGDLGMEAKAAHSAAAGGFREEAGATGGRIPSQFRVAARTFREHSVTHGNQVVNLRDPYLTHAGFGDSLYLEQKNGSSGRTRTYNPPVNSRMLCH